ncbi:phosphatase PAP2 family protein [Microvirga tunisiensis]|uniref:Phosphatase PAP2 family protein n=1 Tax=Pannonibacter tanglangensis TaxID=2750084 RepID=A0A7X5F5T5_9HYPH|nr:phosphatase PAP2 family protein [Pannonibacter sp. XCT-53]NBN80288.1 phosphatase PAP2 family protein [Pannonibacter sp. XCT-53]
MSDRIRIYRETARREMVRFGGWAFRHPVYATLLYIAVVSLIFLIFPGLDLAASELFHDPSLGFFAQSEPFLRQLRYLGPHIVQVIAIASVLVLLLKLLLPARAPLLPLRMPVFLLSTLIVGPGLVVNAILKNMWGRPRPVMVEQFGGDMPYVPVWLPSNWCETNCSFVSGEGSASVWLLTLAFIAPRAWRPAILAVTVPLILALSANRVAFGGHFLSDTLLSWGVTFLVILAAYHVLYRKPGRWLTDAGLDEALTRGGRALHRTVAGLATRITGRISTFLTMFR